MSDFSGLATRASKIQGKIRRPGCRAHSIGNETERAYLRDKLFDKRRALMEAWASFRENPEATNVGAISRRALRNGATRGIT